MLATADADLDSAKTADAMNGFATSAGSKILELHAARQGPGRQYLDRKGPGADLFSTDHVEQALGGTGRAQIDAYQHVKQVSVAAEVAYGKLPPEALGMLRSNGEIDISFVDGPSGDQDLVPNDSNQDGILDGGNLSFDLDQDGRIDPSEETITERELYDATLGNSEAAADSMASLRDAVYDGKHPPGHRRPAAAGRLRQRQSERVREGHGLALRCRRRGDDRVRRGRRRAPGRSPLGPGGNASTI